MNESSRGRAVVLGGSMAGLTAARVLSDHYDEVVVVDRDVLRGRRDPRRGVPQGRHAHGLLARGQQALESMFPGLTADLVADGVPSGDIGRVLRWYFDGRRLAPADTGLLCVSATRPVLERHVRERVSALPNVEFCECTDIVGLVTSSDGRAVTGARVQRRTAAEPHEIAADLVVDATGRGSRTPHWLAQLGYQRPPEDIVRVDMAYTTRHYRLSPEFLDGDLSIIPVATATSPRGAFFSWIGDRFLLSLTGIVGDHPPTDDAGFLRYVASLPVPGIAEALRAAEPIDDPVTMTYPASVRRRYDKLTAFPDGLLVTGDAACTFNPVYGQGMTVSALEALALGELLASSTATPSPRRFHRAIARIIDAPWQISAGGDLDFPGVLGARNPMIRLVNAYMGRLRAAATRDGRITEAFMRAAGLIDPPTALFAPRVVWRVLSARWREPDQATRTDPTRSPVGDLA